MERQGIRKVKTILNKKWEESVSPILKLMIVTVIDTYAIGRETDKQISGTEPRT